MGRHDVIVIGASAGGVGALQEVVGGLPGTLPASVFVVLHLPPHGHSALPQILGRRTSLEVVPATDGAPIRHGRVYVAPPDHHLVLEAETIRLSSGPKENRCRPAADVLFRSAAHAFGERVVGVVLSGLLDDGTVGLAAIKSHGGIAIVQDPDEALFPDMPFNALARAAVDYCQPLDRIPRCLEELASAGDEGGSGTQTKGMGAMNGATEPRVEVADGPHHRSADLAGPGEERDSHPSVFTCPECHGTLWEVESEGLRHYRCRVGHAYSGEALFSAQAEALESALWAALRALEERGQLAARLERQSKDAGRSHAATLFERRSREADDSAAVIRRALNLTLHGNTSEDTMLAGDLDPG